MRHARVRLGESAAQPLVAADEEVLLSWSGHPKNGRNSEGRHGLYSGYDASLMHSGDSGATLGGHAGHYPTPAVKGMS